MIKWYPELYLDEKAEKKIKKLKQKIENGKLTINLYCICLASNPDNILDIMNTKELWFRHYSNTTVSIVGLAYSREGAVRLVEKIALDIYENTDDFSAKDFFFDFTNN